MREIPESDRLVAEGEIAMGNERSILPEMKFPELIGPPARIRAAFLRKIESPAFKSSGPHKWLFYGGPGLGKTSIANMLVERLDLGRMSHISINGKELNVEIVREWRKSQKNQTLGSDFWIVQIDELDRASRDAQDLLLSWLDHMPPHGIAIATSNLDLEAMQERLHTRFQQIRFDPPTDQEIYDALKAAGIPKEPALRIAEGAKGNCRAAEMDATTWQDFNS